MSEVWSIIASVTIALVTLLNLIITFFVIPYLRRRPFLTVEISLRGYQSEEELFLKVRNKGIGSFFIESCGFEVLDKQSMKDLDPKDKLRLKETRPSVFEDQKTIRIEPGDSKILPFTSWKPLYNDKLKDFHADAILLVPIITSGVGTTHKGYAMDVRRKISSLPKKPSLAVVSR